MLIKQYIFVVQVQEMDLQRLHNYIGNDHPIQEAVIKQLVYNSLNNNVSHVQHLPRPVLRALSASQ